MKRGGTANESVQRMFCVEVLSEVLCKRSQILEQVFEAEEILSLLSET
jgi:hypothetical protein